jgi:hypothetical protein
MSSLGSARRLSYTNYQSLQRPPVTSFSLSPRPVRGMDRETAVTLDAGSGYLPRLAHISSGHRFHICKSSIPHLFGPSRLRMLEPPLSVGSSGHSSSSATRWFRRTSVLPKGGSEASSPRRRSSRLRGSEPPRRGSCRPAEVGVPNFIQAQRGRYLASSKRNIYPLPLRFIPRFHTQECATESRASADASHYAGCAH